jgi:hypothetical protein
MDTVGTSDLDIYNILDDVEGFIKDMDLRIENIKLVEENIKKNHELFDNSDLKEVSEVLQIRTREREILQADLAEIMELYKRTVANLETVIGRRQSLLEDFDNRLGAISSEPRLLEHFGKKHAILSTGLALAKRQLRQKIQERLSIK